VAEGNKEIITLVGRRLREAASAEQGGPLPEAIERGLAQLSGIDGAESIPTGHVWTTPLLQEESGLRLAVGCKSCVRPVRAAYDRWP
jgi:hypothetical protein